MNYQRYYSSIVSPHHPILRARVLAFLFLVILFCVPSYPLYGGKTAQSEERSLSELIVRYGKEPIILYILASRNRHITVEVNSTLQEFVGVPDSTYITPRSMLHDIQQIGWSMEQIEELILRLIKEKVVEGNIDTEQLQARIKAMQQRKTVSFDEVISWFETQPMIASIESTQYYDWAIIIYLNREWYSLTRTQKIEIVNLWVGAWKRASGRYITFRDASNDDPLATFHNNSVQVLK